MSILKNIFINRGQKRLRAGWRIGIYFLSFFAMAALANFLLKKAIPIRLTRSLFAFPVIILIALGTLWLAARFLDHRKFKDYGFHLSGRWWLDFLFGLALAAFLFAAIFSFEKVMGWITIADYFQNQKEGYVGLPFAIPLTIGLIAYIIVGFYEEILFRANLIANLSEGLNKKSAMPAKAVIWAFILSSLAFGLAHSINPNAALVAVINIILGGLFIGLPYVLSGELAISIALHISWNFFQGLFFGFPVSGVLENTSVIAIKQGGPPIWTGGAFGPEGGLIGSLAIILGCGFIWLWFKILKRPVALHAKLAEYPSLK
jgi:membrane protease YdiL (CAAX protease family)